MSSYLYFWNIANARFAWRNRFQSDEMRVMIVDGEKSIILNPLAICLDKPDIEQVKRAVLKGENTEIDNFINRICQSLCEPTTTPTTLNIHWFAEMNPGQEIFPSQEYVRGDKNNNDEDKRIYAKLPTYDGAKTIQQASIHSQKIGAAIRHIDLWHGNETHKAIAVNPYGGVQDTSEILRETKTSFYDYLEDGDKLMAGVAKASAIEDISNDVHFVMANLIRGGVFGR